MAEARSTTIEETIRQVVREEVRAALEEHILRRAAPAEPARLPLALLTVEQAAEQCHAKPKTVREWIRSGRLPAAKAGGRRYLVALEDLQRFLASGTPGDVSATVDGEVARIGGRLGLKVTSGY